MAADLVLAPGQRAVIGTGLAIALPAEFEAQIRPRSGLALKAGITVLNSPGTIDADYRGEIGVILINRVQADLDPGCVLYGLIELLPRRRTKVQTSVASCGCSLPPTGRPVLRSSIWSTSANRIATVA